MMKEDQVLQLCCPVIGLLLFVPFMGSGSEAPPTAIHTKGNCTCITSDGTEYNLMPLRRTDGYPRFNVRGVKYTSWNYTYNPCSPVTLPKGSRRTTCHDAALCKMPNALLYEGIGRQQGVRCIKTKDGVIELVYHIVDRLIAAKTSRVILVCDQKRGAIEDGKFEPQDEDVFTFAVIHRCACPNGCTSTTTPTAIKTTLPLSTSSSVSTSSSAIPPTGAEQRGQNSGKVLIVVAISLLSIVAVCVIAWVILRFCRRPCRNCCFGNQAEVVPILGQEGAGNGREENEDRLGEEGAVGREGGDGGEKFPVQVSEGERSSG